MLETAGWCVEATLRTVALQDRVWTPLSKSKSMNESKKKYVAENPLYEIITKQYMY